MNSEFKPFDEISTIRRIKPNSESRVHNFLKKALGMEKYNNVEFVIYISVNGGTESIHFPRSEGSKADKG